MLSYNHLRKTKGSITMSKKLSNEARQHKKEYNAEYVKRTAGAAQKKWTKKKQAEKKDKTIDAMATAGR